FEDAAFDVAVGITLLYTVHDDVAALGELARVVRSGGAMLLLEPAFESLRRGHDVTVHGPRPYPRPQLPRLAALSGVPLPRAPPARRGGLGGRRGARASSSPAPPAAVLAVVERRGTTPPRGAGSDVDRRALDQVFAPLAGAERRWLIRHDVPVGTSVAVVATRD